MKHYDKHGKIITKRNNKHWIYVLNDDITNMIYIGETKRLYTRLRDHANKNGANVTKEMEDMKLIALYKVDLNMEFEKLDNYLDLENEITNYYISLNNEMEVYGGSKTCINKEYKIVSYNSIRPVCYCKLPCEVYSQNDNYIFTCPYKNVKYMVEFLPEELDIFFNSCDFYHKIKDDSERCIQCGDKLNEVNHEYGRCYDCYQLSIREKDNINKKCIL